ncbi:family 10 glycosylhydrolase [Streptomyces spiramenti]|uniref:alpha-amylase n=1 Tax=Streptomyces spiramenti TaxID=2720606 RepID=A0ABX1ALP4_9ACTN|nr:family 10 glycosylhydrolase [Streptomyces spiramenti]NJP65553.1 family 10 glycosylhydrolase [Streptomyces spiramenti]
MRRILPTLAAGLGLLASSLVFAGPAGAAPAGDDRPEQWRSYWVDAFNEGLYTPEQAARTVQDALDINANALIVQVGRRYDCFCNRAAYPRTDAAVDPAPYDPLDEIIEQAHAAGLEVHAWVNVNTLWNSTTPPRSPDHVYNQHGPDAEGADRWLNKKADGTEVQGANVYVDPGHPDVSDYIVSAVSSIVSEYDVDGVNLDYIRYPDHNSTTTHSDWGYNDVSVARFQEAAGRSDVPEPDDAEWTEWRRDQVTGLVRKLYLTMWDIDPSARLSVNAITYGNGPQAVGGWENTRTYGEVLQDWVGWLDEGVADTVMTMNYKRNWQPAQQQMFTEWSEFMADNQKGRQTVNGPGLYLNPVGDSLAQALQALAPTAAGNTVAGWSGYAYANPSSTHVDGSWQDRSAERDALTEALTQGPQAPFAEPAAVPAMGWKDAPSEGHVTGRLAVRGGGVLDQTTVTLKPLTNRSQPVTRTTDGDGWFGFAHVDPGVYLVTVDLPRGVVGAPVTAVKVNRGEVTEARLGNYLDLS